MRSGSPPKAWAIALAFFLLYLSWGTTFFAIRAGVHEQHLPPALFSGTRVFLAGVILFAYLWWRGEPLGLPRLEFLMVAAAGVLLFTFGNGLLAAALGWDSMSSSLAAVLGASTPLWMALVEVLIPRGDRLALRGWVGLWVGFAGVVLLMGVQVHGAVTWAEQTGLLLILASSIAWALGSLALRYRSHAGSHLAAAAYQMVLGGGGLMAVGIALGEGGWFPSPVVTPAGATAFVYLLVVGSLVGFIAFNWLLGHVPASLVGTYAYVNPVVAVLVGCLIGREEMTAALVGGLVIILVGVALVRGASRPARARVALPPVAGSVEEEVRAAG